jgi:hypothetical protein
MLTLEMAVFRTSHSTLCPESLSFNHRLCVSVGTYFSNIMLRRGKKNSAAHIIFET